MTAPCRPEPDPTAAPPPDPPIVSSNRAAPAELWHQSIVDLLARWLIEDAARARTRSAP